MEHSRIVYVLESTLYFLFSQTILFLNQSNFTLKEKKNFKRDLLTEIVSKLKVKKRDLIRIYFLIKLKNSSIHGSSRPYKRATSQLSNVTKSPTQKSSINIPSNLESNDFIKCMENLLNNSFQKL